jgi:hypothetical protein
MANCKDFESYVEKHLCLFQAILNRNCITQILACKNFTVILIQTRFHKYTKLTEKLCKTSFLTNMLPHSISILCRVYDECRVYYQ